MPARSSFTVAGSSPRMRGALLLACWNGTQIRIIPADAGSTSLLRLIRLSLMDHPRGCGEHTIHGRNLAMSHGSSPRMRGAPDNDETSFLFTRIIPADAGSTETSVSWRRADQDHPRGCGEHHRLAALPMLTVGSSPRMRGAHLEILAIPTI